VHIYSGQYNGRGRLESERDFAVLELVLVFRVDIHFTNLIQFLLFDPQDLVTFVLDSLARLLAFFEVIKSSLLSGVRVLHDLTADALRMVSHRLSLLLCESSFSLFVCLLSGNHIQELHSGSSSLGS